MNEDILYAGGMGVGLFIAWLSLFFMKGTGLGVIISVGTMLTGLAITLMSIIMMIGGRGEE